jgi:Ca2+-binding EF-hand superfamily protein
MGVRGTKVTVHNAFFASKKHLRRSFHMFPQDGTVIQPKVFKMVESAYRPHVMPSRNEMRKQLKELVGKRFKTSSEAFQTLDLDHDAHITPGDIGHLLRQWYHIKYSDQEVADYIFDGKSHMGVSDFARDYMPFDAIGAYDPHSSSGVIEQPHDASRMYEKGKRIVGQGWLDGFNRYDGAAAHANTLTPPKTRLFFRDAGHAGFDPSAIIDADFKLRTKISSFFGGKYLSSAWRAFNSAGNPMLSRDELKVGVKKIGLALPDKLLDAVISSYDKRQNGSFNWAEFCEALQVRDIVHENQRKLNVGALCPTEPGPKEANGDFRYTQTSPARRDRVKEVAFQAAQLLSRHDVSAALAAAAASETALLQPQQPPADDAISVGAFSKALAGLRAGLTMEHIRALAQVAHKTATEKSAGKAGSSELSRAAVTDAINSLLSGDQQASSPAVLFSPKKKSFADEKPSDAFESTAALVSPSVHASTRPVSAPLRATSLKKETGSVLEPPSFIKGTLDEIKKSLYGKHVDLRSVGFRALFVPRV